MNEPVLPREDELTDRVIPWWDVLETVFRRRRLILTVTLSTLALATAYGLLRPPEYRATAKLLVKPTTIAYTPVSADAETPAVVRNDSSYKAAEPQINSAVAMLTSRTLIRTVLAANQSTASSEPETSALKKIVGAVRSVLFLPDSVHGWIHQVSPANGLDRAASRASENLRVGPISNSNLIQVSYSDRDPEWAAKFVNSLLETYLSPRARHYEKTNTLKFFSAQRARLRAALGEAKAELTAFYERNGNELAFEDEGTLKSIRVQLEASRLRIEPELAGLEAHIDALETEVDDLSSSALATTHVERDTTVSLLRDRVAELELERSAMLSRFGPVSTPIRDLDRQILYAKHMLTAEKASVSASRSAVAPASESLTLQMMQTRARKAELTANLGEVSDEIHTYQEKIDRFDGLASERNRLKNQLAAAEESFLTYMRKEEQAKFSSAMHESNILNQIVAEAAVVARSPRTGARHAPHDSRDDPWLARRHRTRIPARPVRSSRQEHRRGRDRERTAGRGAHL